jgi:hypothetical protein
MTEELERGDGDDKVDLEAYVARIGYTGDL